MKIKCLIDYTPGIGLTKNKIYEAKQGQKGWFALIDDSGEEYAYPPNIFEVVENKNTSLKDLTEKKIRKYRLAK